MTIRVAGSCEFNGISVGSFKQPIIVCLSHGPRWFCGQTIGTV